MKLTRQQVGKHILIGRGSLEAISGVEAEPRLGVYSLVPWEVRATEWPSLRDRLCSLREEGCHRVRITLLPSLAPSRIVSLPGCMRSEAHRLVAENVSSFFPVADTRQVVVRQLVGTTDQWVATAVSDELLSAIEAECMAATLRVERIRTFCAGFVERPTAGRHDEIVLREGRITTMIRLGRKGICDLRIVPCALVAEPGEADRRLCVSHPADGGHTRGAAAEPAEMANPMHRDLPVHYVCGTRGESLVSLDNQSRRREHALRAARGYVYAAALLLIASITAIALGSHAESRALKEERRQHADVLASARIGLAELDSLHRRMRLLSQLRPGTTAATRVAEAAVLLPLNSYLLELQLRADTAILAGFSSDPQALLGALRAGAPGARAEFVGSIRPEVTNGDTLHRFVVRMTND